MFLIAICGNIMLGYYLHDLKIKGILSLVLPLILSFSFLLIADIDSPRRGFVHLSPQNLNSLAQSLHH